MSTKKVYILTHTNGRLATKFIGSMEKHEGIDLLGNNLKPYLEQRGFSCTISTFTQLDMSKNYAGAYIVYASSEDYGKFYKEYIEDILLRLKADGAILLPDYLYIRAHANKVFQELLRRSFADEELRVPHSYTFGQYEEVQLAAQTLSYPCVAKTSSGSGSSGVALVHNQQELLSQAKRLMGISYVDFSRSLSLRIKLYIWRAIKLMTRHKHKQPLSERLYTNKLIVQDFIPGLEGDYKVLYFYGRYYALHRKNRANDFRASGSGNFIFPELDDKLRVVLNLARKAALTINQPMASLDIVVDAQGKAYLIEYQCVYFGPLTMQYSEYYYSFQQGTWQQAKNTSTLEEEYARAIADYVQNHIEMSCNRENKQ